MGQNKALAGFLPGGATVVEKAQAIDTSRWLRDCEWRQLESLAVYFDQYHVPKGMVIIDEGSVSRLLGIVSAGALLVEKEGAGGERSSLAKLGRGRAIGEISLIDGYPASASVVTGEDTTLLVLWGERFEDLLKEKPALANVVLFKIALTLSGRLRRTSGKLVDFLDSE